MKTGIISRRIRENKSAFFKKFRLYELDKDVVSVEIPYETEGFIKLKPKKRDKVLKKATKMLEEKKAGKIVLTKELKSEPFDLRKVFYKFAPKAVRLAAGRFEINLPASIYVRQKIPDSKACEVIKNLIFDAERIGILTENYHLGEKIRNEIMSEFGAFAEIFPYEYKVSDGITVNLDESELCIFGKWVLKNFTAETETFGYNVDNIEFYEARNGNFEKMIIKNCRCGKNELTL